MHTSSLFCPFRENPSIIPLRHSFVVSRLVLHGVSEENFVHMFSKGVIPIPRTVGRISLCRADFSS